MRVAIVGCEESKWTSEQKEKAKIKIKSILLTKAKQAFDDEIILVSGHCPFGGIDIWAEELSDALGITKKIYPAKVNQWEDRTWMWHPDRPLERDIGYKSRNILIAKTCDILYCIVPQRSYNIEGNEIFYCTHCQTYGHPTNGGCWTLRYAKKLNKENHLVVIP